VQPSDTLSGIAKDKYGAGKFWRVIFDANRDKLDHQDRIYIGQALRIPKTLPAAENGVESDV
jgi:nucleoid-associated protein YgaU